VRKTNRRAVSARIGAVADLGFSPYASAGGASAGIYPCGWFFMPIAGGSWGDFLRTRLSGAVCGGYQSCYMARREEFNPRKINS
jgi:hypothetical protein